MSSSRKRFRRERAHRQEIDDFFTSMVREGKQNHNYFPSVIWMAENPEGFTAESYEHRVRNINAIRGWRKLLGMEK